MNLAGTRELQQHGVAGEHEAGSKERGGVGGIRGVERGASRACGVVRSLRCLASRAANCELGWGRAIGTKGQGKAWGWGHGLRPWFLLIIFNF